MTDSLYSLAMRTCHSPANQLRTKCQMSVMMEGNVNRRHDHEADDWGDNANRKQTVTYPNPVEASVAGSSTQSRPKISFNPLAKEFVPQMRTRVFAKEFVPQTSSTTAASNDRARSPVALLFESQVAAASNFPTNTIDEGPLPLLHEQIATGPLSSSSAGRSYADVASASADAGQGTGTRPRRISMTEMMDSLQELCPYAMNGECRFGEQCVLVHGLKCDYCQKRCLHPTNQSLRELHIKECIEQHEKDMEHSFAVARSADKMCGICMEIVVEKPAVGDRRFGILTACNHCFCLNCIRQWRGKADDYESKVIRGCPECRVSSDYVIPSRVWIDAKEEKQKLIENYRKALRQKECKHYNRGDGICPFGNKCFYRHCTKDGTPVDVGPPVRVIPGQRHRSMAGTGIPLSSFLQNYVGMWNSDIGAFWNPDDDSDFLDTSDDDTDSEVEEAFAHYL